MKTRIALAVALLLTLGSAVAGSFIYAQQGRPAVNSLDEATQVAAASSEVTPEMIAMWKSTAAASDYVMPRRPI